LWEAQCCTAPLDILFYLDERRLIMPDGLADLIREVRLRADGMANHLTELADVGLVLADLETGRTLATQMETLDAEQEALKAALKAKTVELNATAKAARQWRSRVTKRIKAALEDNPALWVEFGITADQ
jgi:hypothetical protein